MRYLILLILSLCTGIALAQQMQRQVINVLASGKLDAVSSTKDGELTLQSSRLEIPIEVIEPFLAYTLKTTYKTPKQALKTADYVIRFSTNGTKWTKWKTIIKDEHNLNDVLREVRQQQFTDKSHRYYQLRINTTEALWQNIAKLEVHFFSPGATVAVGTERNANVESRAACPCAQPEFVGRSGWCANGNCPKSSNPSTHQVTHLVVHHSAGVNSATDWSAIVRAIWDLHVNTNGWSDIGYNWLIDPNGNLYEGRGSDVIGAHFCGRNSGTEGVCVLGNFQNQAPTTAAVEALTSLLAWKSCELDIDVAIRNRHSSSGLNLFGVSGHRDGCATACPGDQFYPTFSDVRSGVNGYIENVCNVSTSIDEQEELSSIAVVPNPTIANFQLSLDNTQFGVLTVRMLNSSGKLVQIEQFNKSTEKWSQNFSLAQFPSGFYFVGVNVNEHIYWTKVVKQ